MATAIDDLDELLEDLPPVRFRAAVPDAQQMDIDLADLLDDPPPMRPATPKSTTPRVARRPDILNRAEAAAYTGATVHWLERHPPTKGGPLVTRIGRKPFYLRADLDDWIPTRRKTACHQPAKVQAQRSSAGSPVVPGGTTSASRESATGGPLAQKIAEQLRARRGARGKMHVPQLVVLEGEKE